MTMSICRSSQHPPFMEEWRKGWLPEPMNPKGDSGTVLGGPVARERRLPELSAWGRVADYREYMISQKPDLETYFDSELAADVILESGIENVYFATSTRWRADGVGRPHVVPIPADPAIPVFTLDDIMDGRLPSGHVVIYDDDHRYMGACWHRNDD